MDRAKIAQLHAKGFNCAQVVAYMCRGLSGVDERTALAAMGGFGGGLRCGEVCGAVCGGVYSLGMTIPYADGRDVAAKGKVAELTISLTNRFLDQYGALTCRELLASGGRQHCEELMAGTVELLREIIEGKNENGNL